MGLYPRYMTLDQYREWQRIRWEVFHLAANTCELCFKNKADQIHHKTYARWMHESPTDLLAVCDICHAKIHGIPANDNCPDQGILDLSAA